MYSQIKLTHNIGENLINTGMPSCEEDESWSRVFKLSDFGVATSDQFIIRTGEVAISKSYNGAYVGLNIFSIDANFPNSNPVLLGRGGYTLLPNIEGAPQIIQFDLSQPIVVPGGVERILVEVGKSVDFYNPNSAEVIIAGTEDDTGISWYKGCRKYYRHTSTTDLDIPVPKANFYINVTGEILKNSNSGSMTRLTHNVCDDIIETGIHSCTAAYIYWARDFYLEDFGISTEEEYTITSGQVGINKTGYTPEISFNIYKIDDNFPASFSESDLIGSSQYKEVSPNINRQSQIIQVDFDTPIVIPADVERILVEVHKGILYGDGVAFIAGSTQDNGVSWQRGCIPISGGPYNEYVSTADFGRPNANFYINVTGNVNHLTNNFEMNISNICSEFLKEFSLTNSENITSLVWNFGDPTSGADNTSTDFSPFHDFSADGTYTVTATVTANDASIEVISETIDVKEPPTAYAIDNVYACEDSFNTGLSTSFDVSMVAQQVLGGQTDKVVTFIDGSGNEYSSLPNLFSNTVKDRETIQVRVAHKDNLCCYSEISFDLIIQPLPVANEIDDLFSCDNINNGYANFDLTLLSSEVIGSQTGVSVAYYNENGILIPNSSLSSYTNATLNKETITARVTNTTTNCYNETKIDINVNSLPVANVLTDLIGCDDNNDGISEFFDTFNVENEVLNGQTGLVVSYFDSSGIPLTLDSPYTNTTPTFEIITVRVTNPNTQCYSETDLTLRTSSKPQINNPQTRYGCDLGSGFAKFDLSNLENEVIGSQTGLNIYIYNENGTELSPSQLNSYQNSKAFTETIKIKVENQLNNSCFTEVELDLNINELPPINLEESYFLCDLEPSLPIGVDSNFNSYVWTYEDGSIISNSENANLINEGKYTILVSRFENGISCQNSFSFNLIRSTLPIIEDINIGTFGSNYVEVIVSGDGDFEYSLDNIAYQTTNRFDDLQGGNYTVYVKDVNGCGFLTKNISILDYPRFFSPNNDGINDTWQLQGDINQDYKLYIFDRFGKLLKQLDRSNNYWDGLYNGSLLPPDDYWFKLIFVDGSSKTGHFALLK